MAHKACVLTVARNRRNLEMLAELLGRAGMDTVAAESLEDLDRVLEELEGDGLALVDLSGFDNGIWQRVEALRHKGVTLLVISSETSAAIQRESLMHGARGVLVKPLVVKEFVGLVRGLLEAA